MKLVISAVSVVFLLIVVEADEKYTTRYDHIDVVEILENDRLLRNYLDCLVNLARCNREGEVLKKLLPDALATDCIKCSDTQRENAKKIIVYLIENKLDWYKELEEIYDPVGEYRKRYENDKILFGTQ